MDWLSIAVAIVLTGLVMRDPAVAAPFIWILERQP
jgi:hypothetical protein